MNNKIFMMFALGVFLFSQFALAELTTEEYTVHYEYESLQVESVTYDPYPVNPGEYFEIWINVHNTGTVLNNVVFELNPEFPFSLDPNEDARRSYDSISTNSILLKYKVRVSEDAVEGSNNLELLYKTGSNGWASKVFEVDVSNSQTNFDGVIQEIEGNTIALALANTGKNIANSVIIKLPEQSGFQSTGTSGQMVGNLENGDYTIVSFDVEQVSRDSDSIIFQIDYTDNIDERRVEYLELPLNLNSGYSSSSEELPEEFQQGRMPSNNSSGSSMFYWLAGLTVVIILFIYRKKIIEKIKAVKTKK